LLLICVHGMAYKSQAGAENQSQPAPFRGKFNRVDAGTNYGWGG
jgi:hypothetical protein